jgi:hypothetical protein
MRSRRLKENALGGLYRRFRLVALMQFGLAWYFMQVLPYYCAAHRRCLGLS